MVFSSPVFLFVFLPAIVGLYFVIHPRLRNVLLLLASLLFYSWGEPPWVMLAATILNYCGGIGVQSARERGQPGFAKGILILCIVTNVFMLVTFKYANFLADTVPKDFTPDRSAEGAKRWKDIWSAGQGVGLVHDVRPVAEIVESLVREAHDTLRGLGR